MNSSVKEFAAKPKAEPREEVTPKLINHLKSTSSLYLLNMDYFKEAKELYKAPKNDNRFMAVAIAMANRAKQSEDYGAALASVSGTEEKDAANAAAVNNHVTSILSEIKNNPEIRSLEDAKMLVQQVKAANAMDVIIGGRAENFAVDAIDFAINGVLESIGKGDVKKGFEALKNGKVSDESVENYGAVAAEKFALTKEKAAELAALTERNAAFAQKTQDLTQEQAIQKYAELLHNYRQLPEQMQKSLKELPGPQILSGMDFKDTVRQEENGSFKTLVFNRETREFLPVEFRSEYDSSSVISKNSEENKEKPQTIFNLKEDIAAGHLERNIDRSRSDLITIKVDPHGNTIKPSFSPSGKN